MVPSGGSSKSHQRAQVPFRWRLPAKSPYPIGQHGEHLINTILKPPHSPGTLSSPRPLASASSTTTPTSRTSPSDMPSASTSCRVSRAAAHLSVNPEGSFNAEAVGAGLVDDTHAAFAAQSSDLVLADDLTGQVVRLHLEQKSVHEPSNSDTLGACSRSPRRTAMHP